MAKYVCTFIVSTNQSSYRTWSEVYNRRSVKKLFPAAPLPGVANIEKLWHQVAYHFLRAKSKTLTLVSSDRKDFCSRTIRYNRRRLGYATDSFYDMNHVISTIHFFASLDIV